jgi:hypothetical protein
MKSQIFPPGCEYGFGSSISKKRHGVYMFKDDAAKAATSAKAGRPL